MAKQDVRVMALGKNYNFQQSYSLSGLQKLMISRIDAREAELNMPAIKHNSLIHYTDHNI
jgi:hypothetical protein